MTEDDRVYWRNQLLLKLDDVARAVEQARTFIKPGYGVSEVSAAMGYLAATTMQAQETARHLHQLSLRGFQ